MPCINNNHTCTTVNCACQNQAAWFSTAKPFECCFPGGVFNVETWSGPPGGTGPSGISGPAGAVLLSRVPLDLCDSL